MAASATSLSLPLDPGAVLGGFLAFIRASAWLVVTPPFSNRSIPVPAKVGLAAGLALAASGQVPVSALPTDTAGLIQIEDACSLCGNARGLLQLGASRVTRTLTPAERREYGAT